MRRNLLFQLLIVTGIFFLSFSAIAQPTVTVTNKKDACEGSANGQFDVTVTSGTGPFTAVVLFHSLTPVVLTLNTPFTYSGVAPGNYQVAVSDAIGGFANIPVTIANVVTPLSVTNQGAPVNNSDCSNPDGSISINVAGGSGNYTYSWTGPNGFTATTQDIAGLVGGSYSLTVSDVNTICTEAFGPVVITDPQPNDRPILNDGAQQVCEGSTFTLQVGNTESGVAYEVFRCVGGDCNNLQTTGVTATSGSNGSTINLPIPNAGTDFVNGEKFKVQATLGICSPIMLSDQVDITVVPLPNITNSPLTQGICSNGTAVLAITADQPGTTFAWTAVASAGTITGFDAVGVGNINDLNIINTGIVAGTVTYTITPTLTGCPGPAVDFVVTVQPDAIITNATLVDDICSNETVTFVPTSNVAGATFSWTASASSGTISGFDLSGTGDINDANVVNTGAVAGTVTYVITPVANGCNGTPSNFVVTVQPAVLVTNATLTQTICSNGTATFTPTSNIAGATFSWTASASTVDIGGFDAIGTGNINDTNIINAGNVAGTVTYVITPTANGCAGTPVNFVVTIQPAVQVTNSPLTQNICNNGTAVLNITSNVVGATFTWTAVASSGNITGFQAIGTGNINDANILNSGVVSGTVTYTITPTANACPGTSSDFVVTVQPNAVITNVPLTGTICSDGTVNFTPTSNVAGATFTWTASASNGNITGFDAVGSGNIADANIINTGTTAGTVTYVITPVANGCNGTASNLVITVQPAVLVTNATLTQNICNDGTAILNITSNIPGATFSWTAVASNLNISGFTANGTGNINDANILNTGNVAGTVTYTIIPTANGCAGTPVDFVVTVQPNAVITNGTLTDLICSNETVTFSPTSNVAGATFSWTASASNASITGFDASGTGDINDSNIVNAGIAAGTVTYVITPTANGCAGTPSNFVVTVQPAVQITNASLTQSICNNGTAILNITSNIPGATFTWTAIGSNGDITGFDANGSGNINDANILNAGVVPGTVTYTIIPNANACDGNPVNFVVTVQPVATITNASLTDDICSGETVTFTPTSSVGGATFTWTASGSSGNITGFDAVGSGNINDANVQNAGITAGTVTYVITPFVNGCAGVPSNFVVTVQPNVQLTNAPLTATICSDGTVTFTPTSNIAGATFSWTASASTANITGFDASGTGNINDLNVINSGTTAGTVTYVITPSANGCNGTPVNFVVTVEPGVLVTNTPLTQSICNNGSAVLAITSNVPGATFTWTAVASSGTITGFDANGSGNINDANILNAGIVAGTVTYTITPTANGCAGTSADFVVTVQPNATISNATLTDDICSNETVVFVPTSNVAGATFSWTASASSPDITGFDAAGAGDINDSGVINAGTAAGTVTYVITPSINGCAGTPSNFVVTVQPNVQITNAPLSQDICNNGTASLVITSNVVGATYSWTAVASSGDITGFDASGSGDINDTNIQNSGNAAGTVTYTITPSAGACAGTPVNFVVTVQPDATITNPTLTDDICNNGTVVFTPTSNIAGATFAWTATASSADITGFDAAGTGNINDANIVNNGTTAGTITYVITASANGCNGTSANFVVTVQPVVLLTNVTLTDEICSDETVTFVPTSNVAGATFNWTAVASGPDISGFEVAGTGSINDDNVVNFGLVPGTVTYTIVPSANGCAGPSVDFVVTVNPIPDASFTGLVDPTCTTSGVVTLVPTTPGGTFSGPGVTGNTFDPAAAGPGTHSISYNITVAGCSSLFAQDVTVDTPPDATITPAGPFCTNSPAVTLTAATPGGTWSGSGITDPVAGIFDPGAAGGAGTKSITYQVTVGGCTTSASINIAVFAAPNATITSAGPFCNTDAPVTLTAVTPGGTWSGPGITDGVLGTFDPASANLGTNTITYTVTVGSCTDTQTTSITVGTQPDATITPVGPFCTADASVTLTAVTPGGTWSGTGITDASAGTFDPATAGAGTHTITYSIALGGCSDSNSISIVVNQSPDATITAAGPFCTTDAAVNLVAATAGGTWSGPGITDPVLGTFDPASANIGNNTISYTVSVGACSDTKSISITVGTQPDATITPVGPFCTADASVTLSAVTPGGTWSGAGITDAAAGTFDPATAGAGTHTITYSIAIGGCSDLKTIDIVVELSPVATITAAGPFCITDAALNLVAATPGGTWSGTGITDPVNGTFDPATAGVGTFVINYSISNGGCSDSDDISITVANPPDASITAVGPFCSGDASVTLTAVTAGGTWSGTGITDAAAGTFDPGTAGAGTHTITYTIAIGGCSDTKTFDIVVNQTPDASITAAGPFCITDAAVNLVAATPGGNWIGTGITDATNGTFAPAVAGVGTFNIQYTIISGSCVGTDQITITVANPPDATITAAGPFCSGGSPAILTAVTPGGTWSGTGITNGATGEFSPSVAGPGTHTITYSITIGGCSDVATTDIVVNESVDATIATAGPFCPSNPAVNLIAATPGGVWAGNGIIDVNAGTFDPAAAGTGTHVITYTITANGCVSSSTINIVVRSAADPACGGGGVGNCATVVITPVPSPATCTLSNGSILFNIVPFTPAVNNTGVIIEIEGVSVTNETIARTNFNDPQFNALPIGVYTYKITYGDVACIKTGFVTIDQSGTVGTPVASNVISPVCAGSATGSVTIDVPGETGNLLEWSLDGINWTSFTAGNQITGIPAGAAPTFERVISIRRNASDPCNAAAIISIQDANPAITSGLPTSTPVSGCTATDGTITIPGITGGVGAKQIRIYQVTSGGPQILRDFVAVTADPHVVSDLGSGTYFYELRDETGCTVSTETSPVTITAPGAVAFNVIIKAGADCGPNAGKNGVIGITFDPLTSSGNYQIGVSTSPFEEPFEYANYFYNIGSTDEIVVDTLSRGDFFVFVKPSGTNVCPSILPTGTLDGPYMIDFDVQRVCGAGDGSAAVQLVNLQGDPLVNLYNVEVYMLSDLATRVDEFSAEKVNDIVEITYDPNGTGTHAWLNAPEDYLIRVYQLNQLYCIGERPFNTPSHEEVYAVRETMAITIDKIRASLPEPRRSGGFLLKNITGGVPFPDSEGPYYNVSVFDPSNNTELFGPIEVRRNSQGRYEYDFRNLPVGNYELIVTDSYGCTISTIVIVPADTRILIPNIFTPNGDAVNDQFEVLNLPASGGHKLVITNRWGKQMFTSEDYQEGRFWDAEDVPEGIYYYRLDVSGDKVYTGWVEVTRGSKP